MGNRLICETDDQTTRERPEDLSVPAIKVARRLQTLKCGRIYGIILTKASRDEWVLCVEERGAAERIRG